MERSREDILSLINDIEQKYDLVDWQIHGMNVWPIIRISIFNELTAKKVTGTRSKTVSSNKFSIFINGVKELFLVRKQIKNAKTLFFASQAHRQSVNGLNYNRFADPMMDKITGSEKETQLLFETAKQNEYTENNYKGTRLVRLSAILELLQLVSTIKDKFYPSKKADVKAILSEIAELPEQSIKKLSKKVNKLVKLIPFYQVFCQKLLHQYKGEKLYFVCYYGLFNMVMINEAKKRDIVTVDIQHGVISEKHIAYGFKKIPEKGYNSLPNEFWTWTNYEADCINSWAKNYKQHEGITKGNPWIDAIKNNEIDFGDLADQVNKEEKPIILYTLSNRDDIFPKFLIEAIKDLSNHYAFWFRLHPRQLNFKSQIEDELKSLGIFHLVELERASYLPLPLILKYTSLHLTQFSTAVLEAAYFEVPSLLFHSLGKTYFEDNPLKSYFYFYESETDSFEKFVLDIMKNND